MLTDLVERKQTACRFRSLWKSGSSLRGVSTCPRFTLCVVYRVVIFPWKPCPSGQENKMVEARLNGDQYECGWKDHMDKLAEKKWSDWTDYCLCHLTNSSSSRLTLNIIMLIVFCLFLQAWKLEMGKTTSLFLDSFADRHSITICPSCMKV